MSGIRTKKTTSPKKTSELVKPFNHFLQVSPSLTAKVFILEHQIC
ncbi:hypothetical protein PTUN_a2843 [Pseudoalteromonas tunicata]|nr:hypothetical protein PTUN_a2843 [Pseudoalteromonas tunicata]